MTNRVSKIWQGPRFSIWWIIIFT